MTFVEFLAGSMIGGLFEYFFIKQERKGCSKPAEKVLNEMELRLKHVVKPNSKLNIPQNSNENMENQE